MRRWEGDGRPEPGAWVDAFAGAHQRRNARAALLWWHRQARIPLELAPQYASKKVPEAFDEEELATVLDTAKLVHPRCEPALQLLYATGARVSELAGVMPTDLTRTHVILRETKRRPGGQRVERAVPLGRRANQAVADLGALPLGRVYNLLGVRAHTVQDWCRRLERGTGLRVHAHKFRATFATHLLQRGVPVFEVQRLMGHTDIATTLRYAAVTDERLVRAVALLG